MGVAEKKTSLLDRIIELKQNPNKISQNQIEELAREWNDIRKYIIINILSSYSTQWCVISNIVYIMRIYITASKKGEIIFTNKGLCDNLDIMFNKEDFIKYNKEHFDEDFTKKTQLFVDVLKCTTAFFSEFINEIMKQSYLLPLSDNIYQEFKSKPAFLSYKNGVYKGTVTPSGISVGIGYLQSADNSFYVGEVENHKRNGYGTTHYSKYYYEVTGLYINNEIKGEGRIDYIAYKGEIGRAHV